MVFKKSSIVALAALSVMACSSPAKAGKVSNIETGLVGVRLYSTGLTVVQKFGSPDSIDSINIGSSQGSGGGAGGASGGPGFAGGPKAGGASGGGGGGTNAAQETGPMDFGDSLLFQGPKMSGGPMGGPGGPGGPGGRGAGGPAAGGAAGPGKGAAGGAGGSGTAVDFTRWVYNRNGSQYSFIFDKYNRVVQIEAIGLSNHNVRTRRGVGFGASISEVIKKYVKNADGSYDPPQYELNGTTIVLKFLVKNHVAFRFSKLSKDGPEVVTGIAVAGGKY